MSDKIPVSARLEEPLVDRIDEYADDREMRRSPAIRELVLEGLAAEEPDHTISLPLVLLWTGSLIMAAKYTSMTGPPVGIATVLLGLALMNDRIRTALATAHARYIKNDRSENTPSSE